MKTFNKYSKKTICQMRKLCCWVTEPRGCRSEVSQGPSNGHLVWIADGGQRSHLTDRDLNVLGFPCVALSWCSRGEVSTRWSLRGQKHSKVFAGFLDGIQEYKIEFNSVLIMQHFSSRASPNTTAQTVSIDPLTLPSQQFIPSWPSSVSRSSSVTFSLCLLGTHLFIFSLP